MGNISCRFQGDSMNRNKPHPHKPKEEKRDPNAPKQPLSSYFIFCTEERSKVKSDHPSYSICDVGRELGRYILACILSDGLYIN